MIEGSPSRRLQAGDAFQAPLGTVHSVQIGAEVFLHGLGIEPACDLLGGGDRELAAHDLNQATAFKLVLEQFALDLCAFQDGIGMAESVGKRWVSKVMKAGRRCGRNVVSLGHVHKPFMFGLEPAARLHPCPGLSFLIPDTNGEVNSI
jgi:hypothetical protein